MSFTAVARKDFSDARRSRSLWALSGLFVLFTLLMTYLYTVIPELEGGDAAELSAIGLLGFIAAPATLFVTLAAIVVCYKAIAGESESGSGKLLLSLPHSRFDVLAGKVLGRWLVLVVPVVGGLLVALGAVFALGIGFPAGTLGVAGFDLPAWPVVYAGFVALTALFALVYVSLVVGISATTASTSKAAALALGAWVVFELLWDAVPVGLVFVANGFAIPANLAALPNWVAFVSLLSPSVAYSHAATGLLTDGTTGAVPFYLLGWFAVLILAVWVVVPATVGYLRYRNADL